MATPGGTITRKDIISDDAINFGELYAKNIEKAIEANKQLVESAKEYNKISKEYKKVDNQNEFLATKQQEKIAFIQATNAIKLEEEALKSAEKVRKEALLARKAELDVIAKEERARKAATSLTIEERVANEANNRALREAAKEKLGLISAYDKLNKQRTEAKNKLRDLIATEGASIEEIKKAQKEFDELNRKVKKADDAVGDFTKNVGNYPKLTAFAGGVKDIMGAFGLAVGIDAAVNILKGAFDTIKKFDQALADLRAITGATGKDLDYLRKNAIELGKDTKGGAVQVVEAYKLIASAKPELLENVQALNAVTKATLTLSKASGLELPDAATRLTDAMNQFNAPAEEAGRYIDALANGAKFGAAEIPDVTDALLKFGAVAKSSNVSIEESTALIELLAEKGLKGAEAGTALRNVLLKISAPDALPKEAKKVFEDLGISMEKLKDTSIPIQERFEMLKPALADNANLVKIFGQENIVAARNVIENTDRLSELTDKMYEYGTAQAQADERTNTLQGKTDKLSATYDSFILSLNEGSGVISSFLSELAETFTFALEGLIRLNTSWDELIKKAGELGKEEGIKEFEKNVRSLTKNGVDELSALSTVLGQSRINIVKIDKELNDVISKKNKLKEDPLTFGVTPDYIEKDIERLNFAKQKQAQIIKSAKERIAKINSEEIEDEKEKNIALSAENEKAKKDAEKAAKERERIRKEYLAKLKQQADDEFNLLKFRKEQEIKISDEIANNDQTNVDDRISALINANNKEEELSKMILAKKLKDISRYNDDIRDLTDEEIEILVNGGTIQKKLRNDEKLALEEHAAKKKEIHSKDAKDRQDIIDSIIAAEEKKIKDLQQVNTDSLNKDLTSENNRYKLELEQAKQSGADIEEIQRQHEENILRIKTEYAKKGLQAQISALEEFLKKQDSLPESERISADKRKKIESDLIEAKRLLSEKEVEDHKQTQDNKLLKEIEYYQAVASYAQQFSSAISDLVNTMFAGRISAIDAEQQKWDEYYSKQMEAAGNDARQKELIQKDAEKKRKELEDKKKKEQIKQAIFNKATAALNVGLSTAQAIMQSYAQMGPIAGSAGAILAGVLGAIQLAAVLATPIPKYEKGTNYHKGGMALVGEVRPEVIEEPGKNPYVISSPTLLNLAKGTKVAPSIDDYVKSIRKELFINEISKSSNTANELEKLILLNFNSGEMLSETKKMRKLLEKNKTSKTVVVPSNQDIPHSIWASNNIKW